MFNSAFMKLREWILFHQTHNALKRLDLHLRRDLGLKEADLRRISRKVMHQKGPISLFALREEDERLEADVVSKVPSACGSARHDAQERRRFRQRPYPA